MSAPQDALRAERVSRILVVEDEESLARGLVLNLGRKGHEVDHVGDGNVALDRATAGRYDLVILDGRLPGLDGFEVCRRLRQGGDLTPILMLTARDQPDDVVFGLKSGADDYMVKPFDLGELHARVEGLLRRVAWSRERAREGSGEGVRFVFGDYWVDFASYQAATREGVVELSRKEIEVMRVFAQRPGEVVTRRELLDRVWELPNHPNTRVVDNVIVALRKAFEGDAQQPRHIHSVRGAGYRFVR